MQMIAIHHPPRLIDPRRLRGPFTQLDQCDVTPPRRMAVTGASDAPRVSWDVAFYRAPLGWEPGGYGPVEYDQVSGRVIAPDLEIGIRVGASDYTVSLPNRQVSSRTRSSGRRWCVRLW